MYCIVLYCIVLYCIVLRRNITIVTLFPIAESSRGAGGAGAGGMDMSALAGMLGGTYALISTYTLMKRI